jgi:hypothetical protein
MPREAHRLKHRAQHEMRSIPIPPALVVLLRAHLNEYGTTRDTADKTGSLDAWLQFWLQFTPVHRRSPAFMCPGQDCSGPGRTVGERTHNPSVVGSSPTRPTPDHLPCDLVFCSVLCARCVLLADLWLQFWRLSAGAGSAVNELKLYSETETVVLNLKFFNLGSNLVSKARSVSASSWDARSK